MEYDYIAYEDDAENEDSMMLMAPVQQTVACVICNEALWTSDSCDKNRVLQKLKNIHVMIFAVERRFRDRPRHLVFQLMLQARRQHVERYLDQHHIPHVKWTMAMLEAHYDVNNGHDWNRAALEIKLARDAISVTDTVRRHLEMTDPETDERVLNLRAVAEYNKLLKTSSDLVQRAAQSMASTRNTVENFDHTLLSSLTRGLERLAAPDDVDTTAVADMYNVGGII